MTLLLVLVSTLQPPSPSVRSSDAQGHLLPRRPGQESVVSSTLFVETPGLLIVSLALWPQRSRGQLCPSVWHKIGP